MNDNTGWWFFLGMVVGAATGAYPTRYVVAPHRRRARPGKTL